MGNDKYCFLEHGVNDIHLGNKYALETHLQRVKLSDSAIAHGMIPIWEGITGSTAFSANINARVDTLNRLDSVYCLAQGIKWFNIKLVIGDKIQRPYVVASDSLHPNRNGNARKLRMYSDYYDNLWAHTDTGNIPNGQLSISDTIIDRLASFKITPNVYSFKAVDSVNWRWHEGTGTDSTMRLQWDSASTTVNVTDWWGGTWNPSQAAFANGDTITWHLDIYGKETTTITGSFHVFTRVYTFSTRGLVAYWQWDLPYRGVYPVNTFTQRMVSLMPHTGTSTYDTLFLGADATVTTDDPTDSTAFGFVALGNDATDRMWTTQAISLSKDFTIVLKYRGYTAVSYAYVNSGSGGTLRALYTSVGNTMELETDANYYTAWGFKGDDSVKTMTSEGDLYMNGVLRVNGSIVTSTALNLIQKFQGKGRYYAIWIFDVILTPTEILQCNY